MGRCGEQEMGLTISFAGLVIIDDHVYSFRVFWRMQQAFWNKMRISSDDI
jgi:hypothetical protein